MIMVRENKMDLIKILSNSTRVRIVQYLQSKGDATTKQIADYLSDIPVPTIYRHINYLIGVELVTVKEERKVRGSIERLLSINEAKVYESGDISDIAFQFLLDIYVKYCKYCQQPGNDPMKDKLGFATSVFRLGDSDMDELVNEMKALLEKYESKSGNSGEKLRSISIISTPTE